MSPAPVPEEVVPALAVADPATNLTDYIVERCERAPRLALFARPSGDAWADVTAAEYLADARGVAKGLMAAGIEAGDRVGIMSKTRYEWAVIDTAVWLAGAVSVPVYETSSPAQIAWNLADSGARAVFAETAEHLAAVSRARQGWPAVPGEDGEDGTPAQPGLPRLASVWGIEDGGLAALVESGRTVPDEDLEARRHVARLDDTATIIYTSGTTGRPKGCELSHGNFVHLSLNIAASPLGDVIAEGAATLLFMPLAHVFARLVSVVCLIQGVHVGHCPDVKNLVGDLQSFRPTFLLAVPRVFEKVYNAASQKSSAEGRGRLFHRAVDVGIAWSRAQDGPAGPGLRLRLEHGLWDRLVYRKLRDIMGGRVRYAVSGGAALGERLGHFYRAIGLTVLEGYGLTETTAPLTVNVPGRVKIGTVGPPLPGLGVRIAADGEILASGPSIMRRYHDNPEATAEAFDGGWFRTGDVGTLDEDGYLRITGRKKELIVTAGGKNVAPAPLEDRVRAHPIVSQCLVVGDGERFVAALVTLDAEMLPMWLANHDLPTDLSVAEACRHPGVRAGVQHAVDRANGSVSRAESIRRFEILDTDFTEANGYLTPSLKVKRALVLRDFAATVERIYAAPAPDTAPGSGTKPAGSAGSSSR